MKHLEVRQKYSAARCIFNSLLGVSSGVSSGDETLRVMFDILLLSNYCMNDAEADVRNYADRRRLKSACSLL